VTNKENKQSFTGIIWYYTGIAIPFPGNPELRGRISAVDLLVQTNSDEVVSILKMDHFPFFQTKYVIKEVDSTEPSPSVRIPCHI
jgi:hypothetical protein